jgi:simple sugar transport system substrate-binding protein
MMSAQDGDAEVPWLETIYTKRSEGRGPFIDKMIQQGAGSSSTTSLAWTALAAAKRYPNVIFAHASGFSAIPTWRPSWPTLQVPTT